MPLHSRWYYVKLWLLKDPDVDFRPAIDFIERSMPESRCLLERRWPLLKTKKWSEVKEEIREKMLEILRIPRRELFEATMQVFSKKAFKTGKGRIIHSKSDSY